VAVVLLVEEYERLKEQADGAAGALNAMAVSLRKGKK
jgi:hypothetical protein